MPVLCMAQGDLKENIIAAIKYIAIVLLFFMVAKIFLVADIFSQNAID
jgi:hypothetical protein